MKEVEEIDLHDGKALLEGPENPYYKHGGYDYGTGKRFTRPLSAKTLKWMSREIPDYGSEIGIGYGTGTKPCWMCGTHYPLAKAMQRRKEWCANPTGPEPSINHCDDPLCGPPVRALRDANLAADGYMHSQGEQETWQRIVDEAQHTFDAAQMQRFGEIKKYGIPPK